MIKTNIERLIFYEQDSWFLAGWMMVRLCFSGRIKNKSVFFQAGKNDIK